MKMFPVLHLITLAVLITVTSMSVISTTAQTAGRSTINGNKHAFAKTVTEDTVTVQKHVIHIK